MSADTQPVLVLPPPLRFGVDEAQAASDEWGFNCGPAALCAVLGLTPAELRPHLGDFERKRYTKPLPRPAGPREALISWGRVVTSGARKDGGEHEGGHQVVTKTSRRVLLSGWRCPGNFSS